MSQANVVINVRRISVLTSIIDVRGDLSASAEHVLMDAYTQASTPTTHVILLNFTELAYMNSSGIGLLVTLLVRVKRQKQHMRAFGLNVHYQHIFELTRLNDVILLYDTEQDALAAAQAC